MALILCTSAVASFLTPVPYIVSKSGFAGDVGFDPLRLSTLDLHIAKGVRRRDSASILKDYREAELKHGRLAMLAAVAWPLQETLSPWIAKRLGAPDLLSDGMSPSLLNGGLMNIQSFLFLVFAITLSLEIETAKQSSDERLSGDYGFRFMVDDDDVTNIYRLQEGEVWNGRIAMLAILGYVTEEWVTKLPIF